MKGARPWSRLVGLTLVLAACVDEEPTDEPPDSDDGSVWVLGEARDCADPVEPFSELRDVAGERGVERDIPASTFGVPGHYLVSVLVSDVDADGDLDLAFNRPDVRFDLYLNDGAGNFEHSDALETTQIEPGFEALASGFVHTDGDGLPDLLTTAFGGVFVRRSIGPGEWGDLERVWDARPTRYAVAAWRAFSSGDLDGDGILDLVLGSLHGSFDPTDTSDKPPPGEAELVLLGDGDGGFSEPVRLVSDAGPGMCQMILLSDHDTDGDLDVFVGSDLVGPLWPAGTLFENEGSDSDGAVRLQDVGGSTGTLIAESHMGGDAADLNGDGRLDYVFSDVGPVIALESDPSGVYVDARAVHDLVPASMDPPRYWTGWSIDLSDLDNDGLDDLVVAAGRVDELVEADTSVERPWEADQPNGIWRGVPDGWDERTDALGFGSIRDAYGLATADFDGDGTLEVVVANELGRPELWASGCSAGAWLQLDLVGPSPNVDGVGALVTVEDDGRRWIQEVYSVRTLGQGAPRLHFGLGDRDSVERITVRWPDGTVTVATDVPTRRLVQAVHPERVE